jgi:UDP-N-acetylmuramyl pentapeptide phosphotransferase/UDP-N-acetylglucosamine-1-phosphate transferase
MLYFLALALLPYLGPMNVLTYHTVRAGGAALSGFAFCLLVGPWIIARLRALKVGQFIKKEHVADLHELHKGKAGTPTMGGAMILLSTLLALLFWGNLSNRFLWISLGVFLLLGGVGFIDDFIKLKRKHNDGLSARAKFAGQILAGLLLGLYLVNNPITISASYVYPRDVLDWRVLAGSLVRSNDSEKAPLLTLLREGLPEELHDVLRRASRGEAFSEGDRTTLLQALNVQLRDLALYQKAGSPEIEAGTEARRLLDRGLENLGERDLIRFNRLLLEDDLPEAIAHSLPNLHTKVGIPGFKDTYIPLGYFYILFVIIIIVSMSNAVNLTDGLDGLAAGISVISILTYAGIAYVISRADWSQYLFLTYVPEASELFVFGGALLGAGLGFLWFNSHPAEVFMGDTGALALGGALGTMGILTKQELLLPVVGGMFVLEALSVVIQVASYKLTGKRVFRMAPLHHHFELIGWTETKVTMRFWIIALLFALMSLSTLKLR